MRFRAFGAESPWCFLFQGGIDGGFARYFITIMASALLHPLLICLVAPCRDAPDGTMIRLLHKNRAFADSLWYKHIIGLPSTSPQDRRADSAFFLNQKPFEVLTGPRCFSPSSPISHSSSRFDFATTPVFQFVTESCHLVDPRGTRSALHPEHTHPPLRKRRIE